MKLYANTKGRIGLINDINGEFLLLAMFVWINFTSAFFPGVGEVSGWFIWLMLNNYVINAGILYLAVEANDKVNLYMEAHFIH
jgi:hypothetical protein